MEEHELIMNDFNLPDHTVELLHANEMLEKYKHTYKKYKTSNSINNKQHEELYENIIKVLDYTGRLSMPIFEINDEMEKLYAKRYTHSPELARTLWLEHYDKLHRPYSLIKNRCFTLLDDLDQLFMNFNDDKKPSNWKY